MVHCVRSRCSQFLSGLVTLRPMSGCPSVALSTPVGLLSVDELDLTFTVLGCWSAIGHSASPRVVLPRVVPSRLVSGVEAIPTASLGSCISSSFCAPRPGSFHDSDQF